MIQRVQFIEGSDSRNELLSDIYLVASPKRFSPHFHGQAKGVLIEINQAHFLLQSKTP